MAKKKIEEEPVTPEVKDEGVVEARPQYEGKDPLAAGDTLVNPSNGESETHYEVKERSEDAAAADAKGRQDANVLAEAHNAQSLPASEVPNADKAEQNEVAAGRVEPGTK